MNKVILILSGPQYDNKDNDNKNDSAIKYSWIKVII